MIFSIFVLVDARRRKSSEAAACNVIVDRFRMLGARLTRIKPQNWICCLTDSQSVRQSRSDFGDKIRTSDIATRYRGNIIIRRIDETYLPEQALRLGRLVRSPSDSRQPQLAIGNSFHR